ncbi:manganese catalase family protein, partial [Bacillus haynesii]|nr:manganese catalase family protein [Bacillus haynesii]
SMDGEGVFQYVEHPQPLAKKPVLRPAPPYIHDTPPSVIQHPRDDVLPPNLY